MTKLSKLSRETRSEWAAMTRSEKQGTPGRGLVRALDWLRWKIDTHGYGHPPLPAGTVMHYLDHDSEPVPCTKHRVMANWEYLTDENKHLTYGRRTTRTIGRGKNKSHQVWVDEHDEYTPVECAIALPAHCCPVNDANLFHTALQSGKTPQQCLVFGRGGYGRYAAEEAAMDAESWDRRRAEEAIDHDVSNRRATHQRPWEVINHPGKYWVREWWRELTANMEAAHDLGWPIEHSQIHDDDSDLCREGTSPAPLPADATCDDLQIAA